MLGLKGSRYAPEKSDGRDSMAVKDGSHSLQNVSKET